MSSSFDNKKSQSKASNSKSASDISPSNSSVAINLRELLDEAVFVGAENITVRRCCNRADRVQPGDVFIPRNTAASDEHDHIELAVKRGASAVVTERILPTSIPQCLVADTAKVYGQVCQSLAGNPAQRLLTIGIVGTHGKTTTALFVASMLKRVGGSVAYSTSLGTSDSQVCDRTATRPPGANRLAKWLKKSDANGAPAAIIEITPSMLNQQALSGIEFDLLIVTGTRTGQFRGSPNTKTLRRLLRHSASYLAGHGMVLFNADDASTSQWISELDVPAMSYGLDMGEHVRGKRLGRFGGEQQLLLTAGNLIMPMNIKIPGDHTARAALAAVATSYLFDLSIPEAIAGVEALQSVPGRLQRLHQAVDVPIFIDEGESPDRLAVALHALRQHQFGPATVVAELSTRLSPQFRQRLGEVLNKTAQRVVLTASDMSPEAAQSVAMDVLGGFDAPGRVQVIPDRQRAIEWAINHANTGCILLSGCGIDNWIDRSGEVHTDESVAKSQLLERRQCVTFPKLSVFPPPENAAPPSMN